MPATAYSPTSRWLHWISAALVLALIIVGILLDKLPEGPIQNAAFDGHRATGVLVMLMTLWRLVDRARHPPTPHVPRLTAFHYAASKLVHFTLYALLIANPLVGLVGSWIYGAPLNVFWLFAVPSPFATSVPLAEKILGFHALMGWAIAAALVLHIGGAAYHAMILKDGVLQRMTGSSPRLPETTPA